MSKDKASKKPMPPCFLTARFPLVFPGDGPRERLHEAPPAYEKQGHVFYQTELEFVAEKLGEMFRQDNPVPAAVGEPADGPKVVFEVVNGTDVELTRRVRYMGEVQQLEEIRRIGHPDPEAWALFGLPHDRRTVLLVRHYEQARQWEPLVVAALREGNPRDWGQDPDPVARRGKAFGSSPGGRGRAGQRKARLSRESAPEKSSSAGAHPAISPNENGAERPAKVRTRGAQSVLKSIAEQFRAIPGKNERILDAEKTAGRLLAEALKHGAFARIKHTHLRASIDGAIEKGLYHVAFGSAVEWFRLYEPHWPALAAWQNVGSSSCFKNGCPLLADVLEAEADVPESERVLTPPVPGRLEAVAKAEELQRRKENARLHEQHLRRFGVVYGRRGGIVGGQPPAAAGAGKEDMGEVGPPSLPATPLSETRCVPMPLVELCRRYMDDKDARSDKVKPLLARYGLRQEVTAKNKWTIRLDDLDAKTRERITRPTYE